jgi:hypothetical protein
MHDFTLRNKCTTCNSHYPFRGKCDLELPPLEEKVFLMKIPSKSCDYEVTFPIASVVASDTSDGIFYPCAAPIDVIEHRTITKKKQET